jgi:hypothetical protein
MSRKSRLTQARMPVPASPPTNGSGPNGRMIAKATARGIVDITNKDRLQFQL